MKFHKRPVSIIIPLHNEEGILVGQIGKLKRIMSRIGVKNYEVVLVENGSADQTFRLAYEMTQKDKRITVIKTSLPHYGYAIKRGLLAANNDPIIQLDLDLIDENFIKQAIVDYGNYDILVGSKYLGKKDNRSLFRKVLSLGLKKVINVLFDYYGTDTHGIKAYKNETINGLLAYLPMTKHMFDTSIVIEAENKGLIVKELPVNVKEIRPSRFPSTKRIFEAIIDVLTILKYRFVNSVKIKVQRSRSYIANLKFPIPFI